MAGGKTRIDRIQPSAFARALIDVVVPDAMGKTSVDAWRVSVEHDDRIPGPLKRQLLLLAGEVSNDFNDLRIKVEQWFDEQMAMLSEGYRKRAKWFSLVFGLLVAGLCNVDAIEATEELYRDDWG